MCIRDSCWRESWRLNCWQLCGSRTSRSWPLKLPRTGICPPRRCKACLLYTSYSYFYLDQEGRALLYFEKALEVRPGDDDTKEFIDRCKQGISLPQFWECFRDRTENWWETFAEMEAELRQMMDDDKDHTRGAELVAQMQETLNLVFDEISFEMGFNGEKYELILTPEGDKVKLFELIYFQKHASKEVLEHWNILVLRGREGLPYPDRRRPGCPRGRVRQRPGHDLRR